MTGTIGVITALPEEMAGLPAWLRASQEQESRGRVEVLTGELWGSAVALTVSGVGAASAARAATLLIERHGAERLLVTGTAGAWGSGVGIGDVVVGEAAYNWDFDARPLVPRFIVPGADGRGGFETDPTLRRELAAAAEAFLAGDLHSALPAERRRDLAISEPKVIVGNVASGQTLVLSRAHKRAIAKIPGVRCLDFESAAVAQVGWDLGVPVGIVRSVSNTTRDAADDYARFLSVAGHYTTGIVRRLLTR